MKIENRGMVQCLGSVSFEQHCSGRKRYLESLNFQLVCYVWAERLLETAGGVMENEICELRVLENYTPPELAGWVSTS